MLINSELQSVKMQGFLSFAWAEVVLYGSDDFNNILQTQNHSLVLTDPIRLSTPAAAAFLLPYVENII